MFKAIVAAVASFLHIQAATAGWTSDATYTNAKPATLAADPYVRWDAKTGQYWAYSTDGAEDGWLFGIYTSPDLATWHKQPGGAIRNSNESRIWANDWFWAPECYYNEKTGWYFFFYAGRYTDPQKVAAYFKYPDFEEASKVGVAVSRSPGGPFINIDQKPIDYFPFDPDYRDVNLLMSPPYLVPPATLVEGNTAPLGTYIPFIDPNVFFDDDGSIWLFFSRNAYRNWVWSAEFARYVEESNIYAVRLDDAWWRDPHARTMPAVHASFRDAHKGEPKDWQTSVNASFPGPTRKDGWVPVISYKLGPQVWENAHVYDYEASQGTRKNRRWSEGSTTIKRRDSAGNAVYFLTYSANNFESPDYGVGYAYASKVSGPYTKSPSNPILSQDPSKSIYSTGHGSIVAAQGKESGNAELFYTHHARPSTSAGRYLYNARLFVEPDSLYVGFGPSAGDLRLPRGVAPFSIAAKPSSASAWDVTVRSASGAEFDLANPGNRLLAWVEGATGAQVSVQGSTVHVSGATGSNAKLYVRYQRARWNETEPWANVSQSSGIGAKAQFVQTVLPLSRHQKRGELEEEL
ncbi:glycoside hydrolase family 43 protein [Exidia glandulosa HHB12029]|uniref:Glycoside hydrolase family 43 protein n=1 Tax=Exidia glandulosa HHB12029 TaxID=1314781 RepID=A0A165E5D5_EXIGL|nr:glycoside hydrolase family 43 protein [Exidia glandulosa HHB12029]